MQDNKWQPADIWLIDPSFKSSELPTDSLEKLNTKLYELLIDKKVVPISLKKVASSPRVEEVNFLNNKGHEYSFESIKISENYDKFYESFNGVILFKQDRTKMKLTLKSPRTSRVVTFSLSEATGAIAKGGSISWASLNKDYPNIFDNFEEIKRITDGVINLEDSSIQKFYDLIKPISNYNKMKDFEDDIMNLVSSKGELHRRIDSIVALGLLNKKMVTEKNKNDIIKIISDTAGSRTQNSASHIKIY
jgi:hypothetical protein